MKAPQSDVATESPPPRREIRATRFMPAPRLGDRLRPLLYPLPGGESGSARSWRRGLFWLAVVLLALAGVVAPYLLPDAVRRLSQSTATPLAEGASLPPGTVFRDCPDESCPWLVVLPPGKFTMGSPKDEPGRDDDEDPQHEVVIAQPPALMQAEVTRAQYAAFVAETHYQPEGGCYAWSGMEFKTDPQGAWNQVGFPQTDSHPVVCLSWYDASAYAQWLSKRTGRTYRLPSEAEWEYAARAGSTTRYAFGDNPDDLCTHANVADRSAKSALGDAAKDWTIAECTDGFAYTAPVKSFKPNAFGLYDMHGNAWEWTEDCYHDNYRNAPGDGSAWIDKECQLRIPRGGAWDDGPRIARSAFRLRNNPGDRSGDLGFRLARTLP